MGVKEILRLKTEDVRGNWHLDRTAVREAVKQAFGDTHIHIPVNFGIEGTTQHGVVCADCGVILQWG